MNEAVIIEAVRSPMGRRKGSLRDTRPDDLAAEVIDALLERTGIDPHIVEDLIMGCVTQVGEQGFNVARTSGLISRLPLDVAAVCLNRMCGSGLQAFNFAAQGIMSGMHDCIISAGVESMTRVPMGSDGSAFSEQLMSKYDIVMQGTSAELIAAKWGLSRQELDLFSYQSHQKAAKAREEGRFRRETVPVRGVNQAGERYLFAEDETIRPDTTLEKMASLPPAFKPDGVITAGNSSQISDGAAAVLVMSAQRAKESGLKPRARFVSSAVAGVDPTLMLTGPIPTTRKALAKAGLTMDDIDIFEVNEAFAPVVLAWAKELELSDMSRVNPVGGAISLGHPLGCSGTRLIATLLHQLEDTGGRYGLITMCIGWGIGIATVIERLP
ncbi:MAG: thiolase family protein [Dethiobacter sp.]|nr:thiolase family protein [Dethiobacter sp.]